MTSLSTAHVGLLVAGALVLGVGAGFAGYGVTDAVLASHESPRPSTFTSASASLPDAAAPSTAPAGTSSPGSSPGETAALAGTGAAATPAAPAVEYELDEFTTAQVAWSYTPDELAGSAGWIFSEFGAGELLPLPLQVGRIRVLNLTNYGQDRSMQVGLDVPTGSVAWRQEATIYRTHCHRGPGDGEIACLSDDTDGFQVVDVATGAVKRAFPAEFADVLSGVTPDAFYTAGCRMDGCNVDSFTLTGSLRWTIQVPDSGDVAELPYYSFAATGEAIYFQTPGGYIYALAAADGAILDTYTNNASLHGSATGYVAITEGWSDLTTTTFINDAESVTITVPGVLEGLSYGSIPAGLDPVLLAYSHEVLTRYHPSGRPMWEHSQTRIPTFLARTPTSILVTDFGFDDPLFTSLDVETGAVQWTNRGTGSTTIQDSVCQSPTRYVALGEGYISAWDKSDGVLDIVATASQDAYQLGCLGSTVWTDSPTAITGYRLS